VKLITELHKGQGPERAGEDIEKILPLFREDGKKVTENTVLFQAVLCP
jgi:hypothetical protein